MPSYLRSWVTTLSKKDQPVLDKYFGQHFSPSLILRELQRIKRSKDFGNSSSALQIKVLQTSTNCSVSAIFAIEEFKLSIHITIPSTFPLSSSDISGGERLGISESKWRSWLLATQLFFKSENINILEGIMLWRQNVEKSFEGMEPCPICYSIFHPSDRSLPGPSCKTCRNKYHPSCLYKWFKSSGNATCAMCRAVF